MKTVLIEEVMNGWVVRPQEGSLPMGMGLASAGPVFVYAKVEELQEALPALLGTLVKVTPKNKVEK